MSAHVEWESARYCQVNVVTESGAVRDGHGNSNDQPALCIGESTVIEGDIADLRALAMRILDAVEGR